MYIHRLSSTILFMLFILSSSLSYPESEFLKKGLKYYQNNEFELAKIHFEEAKRVEPKNSLVYFYLGNTYYQLNDLDNAILNYTSGIDYTDKKGVFFYNLGNCYFLKGNYQFSTEMFSEAVSNDPEIFDSYLNAGNAFYKIGDFANTIVQWETYIEKNPETPQYENIERAIAYLKEEISKPVLEKKAVDQKTGLDVDLLNEVIGDLDKMINGTKNIMETSEKPVDDLTIQEIEK